MIVAIGSTALQYYNTNIIPKDLDLVADLSEKDYFYSRFCVVGQYLPFKTIFASQSLRIEVEWNIGNEYSNHLILNQSHQQIENSFLNQKILIPSIDILYSILRSHLVFPTKNWKKHMKHYFWLQDHGAQLDLNIFQARFYETALRLKYDGSCYRKTNSVFFQDRVKRKIPHDQLHHFFCFGTQPSFHQLKYDANLAWVEIDLFNQLSFHQQCQAIWEEALVLGAERYLLIEPEQNQKIVANKILFELATNLYQIEFRPFIIDNFRFLLTNFPYYFWSKFINENL